MPNKMYSPEDFSRKEVAEMKKFNLQRDDAELYFLECIKPRLDRSYKLFIAYNGDRAKEIQPWQANVMVPYIQAVVETLLPRILDARPDFTIQGRNEDDQLKAEKIENLTDYTWEIAEMDKTSEMITRSALISGTGYLQTYWKKDVRKHKFLKTKNIKSDKYEWKEEEQTFYDAPYAEWVDNYDLWYDWHNIPAASKQFWFRRKVLSGQEIKRRYPMYDKKRLDMAFEMGSGEVTNYASIRNEVKSTHDGINKNSDRGQTSAGASNEIYENAGDKELMMYEVYEWWRPFDDKYSVHVGSSYVPILKGGFMPIPYDFKEAPFIDFPYLKLPGEYEGYGLPMILENPQIMLNMIKNQRLDAMTLNIHKMWIVNPLANIDKKELVTRPFGIIYSTDPNGVREVEFSDVKASAYKEEELLKGDMRYASGVDDFSMGAGGSAGSATEVRHLRESTLERVRMFVNHLGSGYAKLMRYWLSMYKQFYTKEMVIRVIGEDGEKLYPLIEKDDLMGDFDYKAAVMPSIAGKMDIEKKQGMDLFQLLVNLPFVDQQKLTGKILHSWNWNLDSVSKSEQQEMPPIGPDGQPIPGAPEGGMPPEMAAMMQGGGSPMGGGANLPRIGSGDVSPEVIKNALGMLKGAPNEASSPINLLEANAMPPTVPGVKGANPAGKTTNPRGMNMGGKVNTNIPTGNTGPKDDNMLSQAANIQK